MQTQFRRSCVNFTTKNWTSLVPGYIFNRPLGFFITTNHIFFYFSHFSPKPFSIFHSVRMQSKEFQALTNTKNLFSKYGPAYRYRRGNKGTQQLHSDTNQHSLLSPSSAEAGFLYCILKTLNNNKILWSVE